MIIWVCISFPAALSPVQCYKENVLEPMLNGSDKVPPLITDYKEYHTDTTVRFVVKMTEEKLCEAEAAGLHKVFKLQNTLTCNSMVAGDTRVHICDDLAGGWITDFNSSPFL